MECAYASQRQIPFPLSHASYRGKRLTATVTFVFSRVGGLSTRYDITAICSNMSSMNTGDKPLTVRVSSEEMAILEAYEEWEITAIC